MQLVTRLHVLLLVAANWSYFPFYVFVMMEIWGKYDGKDASNLEIDNKAVEFLFTGAAVKVLSTCLQQDTDKTDTEQMLWRIKQW